MSRIDDLVLSTSFDQSIETEDTIFDKIDAVINNALQQKNAYIALNACKTLVQFTKVTGLSLAKILYFIYVHWEDFGIQDEFEDVVYEYIGLHKYTVQKYIKVWAMHEEKVIPAKFEEAIIQKNILEQIPIANALKQGYTIEDDNWNRLANASDFNEIAKIIREDVKNKPPSVDALRLYLDKMGTLWAYKKDIKKMVGTLQVHDNNEVVQQAIQRIIHQSGIMEE